jgi:hypothetical protein
MYMVSVSEKYLIFMASLAKSTVWEGGVDGDAVFKCNNPERPAA